MKFSGGNLGAYATLINRGLFVDALLMANFLNVNYNHSALLTSTAGNAVSVGGHFDMGYRFNFKDGWFAEPLATIDAVVTNFNKFDLPGVDLDLNTNKLDMRGRLGARVGTSIVKNGYRWEPSVTASVWHSFSGDNFADLTADCYTLNLTDANSHLTYGEIGAALNVVDLGTRWSAFLKGDYRFAEDYYGGSLKWVPASSGRHEGLYRLTRQTHSGDRPGWQLKETPAASPGPFSGSSKQNRRRGR